MLLTGAAALAISSAATAAQQGKGQQGKGKNNRSAQVERSQKQVKAGNARRSDIRVARANNGRSAVRVKQNGKAKATGQARVKQNGGAKARVEARGNERRLVRVQRDDRRFNRVEVRRDNRNDPRLVRIDRRFNDNDSRVRFAANGCPPGLAKTPGLCMPPGQVKKLVGQPLRVVRNRVNFRELPTRLRTLYRDDDDSYYRYGNGYVYRINRDNDVIRSLLPLFGLGSTIGQPFPTAYANSFLPTAMRSFYPNTPTTSYRYANGYVYQVDPRTGLIADVDPMLGYGYGYGQMMPASYSAYNVPTQYRSLYQDNNNHLYRYAPGSIYRVDAGSGLIDSVAALLMPGGLSVGQQLPMGYDAYNVPLGFRSQYYDTPQNMYRYANNSIYQVDPTTRLVTAIISALI
jgi:hypothetical protein